jgi:hypothetical protein
MGHDFDVPTDIPPHFPTPMGLVQGKMNQAGIT